MLAAIALTFAVVAKSVKSEFGGTGDSGAAVTVDEFKVKVVEAPAPDADEDEK